MRRGIFREHLFDFQYAKISHYVSTLSARRIRLYCPSGKQKDPKLVLHSLCKGKRVERQVIQLPLNVYQHNRPRLLDVSRGTIFCMDRVSGWPSCSPRWLAILSRTARRKPWWMKRTPPVLPHPIITASACSLFILLNLDTEEDDYDIHGLCRRC